MNQILNCFLRKCQAIIVDFYQNKTIFNKKWMTKDLYCSISYWVRRVDSYNRNTLHLIHLIPKEARYEKGHHVFDGSGCVPFRNPLPCFRGGCH